MSRRYFLFGILVTLLFTQGCTVYSNNGLNTKVENILIPEPQPLNFRSQLAVSRYTQLLNQPSLTDSDRAELLFLRATHYDSLGLAGLAQYDYGRAKQLRPDMAEAYNSIGIHYTQQMNFIEAYESFDSALDINPELSLAKLNRGIALYYGQRITLAVEDLQAYQRSDVDNPFAVLWLYLADKERNPDVALTTLRENRENLDEDNWANSIIDFYLGDVSRNELLNRFVVGVSNVQELNQRMCEVYFYLGKYYAKQGKKGLALNYFKMVLSTNVYEYVEHRYARLEINMLRKASNDNT